MNGLKKLKLGVALLSLAVLAGVGCLSAFAVEVTAFQAETAARNWVRRNPKPMDASFASSEPVQHRTFVNDAGNAIYHVVDMEGGGFVVTSADTTQTPILCFSGSGTYDDDDRNPLKALLGGDLDPAAGLPLAFAAAAAPVSAGGIVKSVQTGEPESEAEAEWAELLADDDLPLMRVMSVSSQSSLDDVRVAPLVSTKWSQSTWGDCTSTKVYNYYTPNNYVCGCVATAGAQIMKKWGYPTGSVTAGTYECYLGGSAVNKTMMGGTYNWSNMPLSYAATPNISSSQCQAIGKLTYDLGVASRMEWSSSGSGTFGMFMGSALRNRFGYASANTIFIDATAYQLAASAQNAIYSSLDAGMPVAICIKSSTGGHCVVVDGYGYKSGTRYSHLNCGWSGSSDVWYNLMGEALTSHSYTTLDEVVYNVNPTVAGDTISGRVLNASGAVVSGATVTLEDSSGSRRTATTNSKGIYYFRIQSSGSYQVSAASGNLASPVSTLSITRSVDSVLLMTATSVRISNWGTCGSKWGVNLTLSQSSTSNKPDLYFSAPSVTPAWPAAVYLSSTSGGRTAENSFEVNDTIYLHASFGNKGAVAVSTPYKVLHQVLQGSTVVKTYTYDSSSGDLLAVGRCSYWDGRSWDILQGLSAGNYTYKITLDSTSNVAESDESNNVATYAFTVTSPTPSVSLPEAVDNASLTITTGGSASWFGQSSTYYSGSDAAQSGAIGHSETSWMQTTVSGAGTLSFRWKVSSEARYDKLHLYVDGSSVTNISGTVDWQLISRTLTGTGSHTIRWSYEKDGSASSGSDCGWVDCVTWTSAAQVTTFNANGGTCSTSSYSYTPGGTHVWLPRPKREGYLFTGWFTSASGGEEVNVANTVPASSRTLYAHWSQSALTLADALTASGSETISFTTGGDAPWLAHRRYTYDSVAAAWNGVIGANQSSWLQTTVSGPGTLSFRWCTSCEAGYDKLRFIVDGTEVGYHSQSGSSWDLVSTNLTTGLHTIRWSYTKDGSVNRGWDCGWLDDVKWVSDSVTVTFDANGGSVSPSSRTYTKGSRYGTLPTPTKANCRFLGWYTAATGGSQITASSTVPNVATTLYAQWEDINVIQLSTVLNGGMTFTSSDTPWFGQTEVAYDDDGAAQSGAIGHGGSTWMETTVTGSGDLSFMYKISTEANFDKLLLTVDGTTVTNFSGEVDWTEFTWPVSGTGSHTIRWTYRKDGSVSRGSDACWVDCVSFGTVSTVTIGYAGGSANSDYKELSSGSYVIDCSDKPDWITALTCQDGSSSVLLGSGTTTRSLSGNMRFAVTCARNSGAARSWSATIRSSEGDLVYTLNVVQEVSPGSPNLGFIEACDWPSPHYMSTESGSYEETSEFQFGETIYLNVSFWNNGGDAVTMPFVIRHELLDEEGNVLDTWNYTESNQMPASTSQCRCWHGYAWSALSDLAPGTYTHRCTLDATSQVDESDEDDNVSECTFEVVAEQVTVTFDPNGDGATVSFSSRAYDEGSAYGTLPTATRAGYAFDGWFTAAVGGTRVTESSVVLASVTLYAHWTSTARPDLTVSAFSPSKTTASENERITLSFTVRNAGEGAAAATRAQVLRVNDGTSLGYVAIPALAAGATHAETFGVTLSSAGSYQFAVVADSDNAVAESDESNNRSPTVTVTVADDRPWTSDDVVSDSRAFPTVFEEVVVNFNDEPAPVGSLVAAFLAGTDSIYGLGEVGSDGQTTFYVLASANRQFQFRLWNSDDGEIYDLSRSADVTITNPGDLLTGLIFDFSDSRFEELELTFAETGWHLMSFNVLPGDAAPGTVMASVADKVDYVIGDAGLWNSRSGGNLSSFQIGLGYWVHTKEDNVSWRVSGDGNAEASISLIQGWNVIGYTLPNAGSARIVLASAQAAGKIRYVCTTESQALFPQQELTMTPGVGYWVYANSDCTFAYDATASAPQAAFDGAADANPWSGTKLTKDERVFPTVYEDIAVRVDGQLPQKGDVLAIVRDNGAVYAVGTVDDEGKATLQIYAKPGYAMHYEFWQQSNGLESPDILSAGSFTTPDSGAIVTGQSVNFVPVPPVTLTAVTIGGPDSIVSESSATYACTATYSDGSTRTVTPTWSIEAGASYASITADGVLTATLPSPNVEFHLACVVKASFSDGEVTQTATKSVFIDDITTTVTFDANGGVGGPSPILQTNGVAMAKLSVSKKPTRTQYSFQGYYDAAAGGVQYYSETLTSVRNWDKKDAAVTLYAHWTYVPEPIVYGVVGSGCEEMGEVSGGGSRVSAGDSVTLKAAARKGYVFAGWYLDETFETPAEGTVDYRSPSFTILAGDDETTLYARFLPTAEDYVEEILVLDAQDEYARGEEIAPIAITVDSGSLPTVTVKGLPTGLKFAAKAVYEKGELVQAPNTIYGTPAKSGIFTATISVKTVGKATATETLKIVVRGEDEALVDVEYDSDCGKVTGAGICAEGKTLTLKATANKGYVFAGWFYDGEYETAVDDLGVDYRSTSLPVVGHGEDVTYYAWFIESDCDTDIEVFTDEEYDVACNDEMELPLDIFSFSMPTVSASGLPSGLKLNAKTLTIGGTPTKPGVYTVKLSIKNATVKQAVTQTFVLRVENIESPHLDVDYSSDAYVYHGGVAVEWKLGDCATDGYEVSAVSGLPAGLKFNAKTGMIEGVPTKTGVSTVTVTLKNGSLKSTATVTMTVEELETWAYGTFNGGSSEGQAKLTISKAGKISGKYVADGVTYTLSAASFASWSDGAYVADVTVSYSYKEGTKTVKTSELWTLAVYEGDLGGVLSCSSSDGAKFEASQNLWAQPEWKALGLSLFGRSGTTLTFTGDSYGLGEGEKITMKIRSSGSVTVKGRFLACRSGIPSVLTVTGTSAVCVTSANPFEGCAYVYFPPNAKKGFEGYVALLPVRIE